MNGFELLAAVKADKSMKYLPVILLSARAGDDAAIEGLQAGAGNNTLPVLVFLKTRHPHSFVFMFFYLFN